MRIGIPGDALSANPSLREKTLVAGYIARAAAALRAEGIDVYGPEGPGYDVLISVLEYLSYPAYVRKVAVPLKEELRYAGILPPVTIKSVHEGFVDREEGLFFKFGIVLKCLKGSTAAVDAGTGNLLKVRVKRCKPNSLIMIGFDEKGRVVKVLPAKRGIWRGEYLGFEVRTFPNIFELINFYKENKMKVVATSKRGEWPGKLREFVGGDVGVLFGSPDEGLLDKYSQLDVDAVVNVFPCQGVKTLRLEEALWSFAAVWSSLEGGLC